MGMDGRAPESPDRRRFLRQALGLGGLAAASPFAALLSRAGEAGTVVATPPLRPIEDQATGLPLLSLPEGFSYRSMSWTNETMGDGIRVPQRHDGMAVVREDADGYLLVRNHEITVDRQAFGPEAITYDAMAGGGTTTLRVSRDGELVDSWVSISGTLVNCAGGLTPWGSWLTCEETVLGVGDRNDRSSVGSFTQLRRDHGYVFEVPPEGAQEPEPIRGMGRFVHEATATDPATGIVYLTEDNRPCGLYRYVPDQRPTGPGELARGGRLQMMRVSGDPLLIEVGEVGQVRDVDWVDIDDPERRHRPEASDRQGVFAQGQAQGGAWFTRLEGCWFDRGALFLTATDGGPVRQGQVWRYHPSEETLTLVYASPDRAVLDHPDNICVTPRGSLILCEDGGRSSQLMHALTLDGRLLRLARNDVLVPDTGRGYSGSFEDSEWAGACFSPDGRLLFVNVQSPGITFAITGPWEDLGI